MLQNDVRIACPEKVETHRLQREAEAKAHQEKRRAALMREKAHKERLKKMLKRWEKLNDSRLQRLEAKAKVLNKNVISSEVYVFDKIYWFLFTKYLATPLPTNAN